MRLGGTGAKGMAMDMPVGACGAAAEVGRAAGRGGARRGAGARRRRGKTGEGDVGLDGYAAYHMSSKLSMRRHITCIKVLNK